MSTISMGRVDALEVEIEKLRKECKQRAMQYDQLDVMHRTALNELNETKRKQHELQTQVCDSSDVA
jgi:hypothetical protein